MSSVIKVSTEELVRRANDASTKISRMDQCLQSIERTVNATRSYWVGEGAESCRQRYDNQTDEIEEVMRRLRNQPKTLLTIGNVYSEAEEQNRNRSAPLPTNPID